MNKQIKEILDEFEASDPIGKQRLKMLYGDEEINKFDVRDWEEETGMKSHWGVEV